MNRAFNNNDDEDIRNETLTNISNPSSHDILVLPLGVHSNPISSSCFEQNKNRIIQKKTRSACFTKAKRPKMIMHERYTTPDIISFSSSSPWVPYTSYNSHLPSHTPSFVCAPTERAHKYKHNLYREQHKNSAYTKR